MEVYYPPARESLIEILQHLQDKGFIKDVDGLYDEIDELTTILNKKFEEQQDMFKRYMKAKGYE